MKTTIENKTFDTETATQVAEASNNTPGNDFRSWWETLYVTRKSNWFLMVEEAQMKIQAGAGQELIILTRKA